MVVEEQLLRSAILILLRRHSVQTDHEIWPSTVNKAKFARPVGNRIITGFYRTFLSLEKKQIGHFLCLRFKSTLRAKLLL